MSKEYILFIINILDKNKPYMAMIFVQLVYAGMSLFSKAAITKGMNPYVFVAYRQGFATVALAPFAFFIDRKKADPISYGLIWKIFFVSLFGITLSLNLFTYSMSYVSATFASASINTIPALTFLIALLLRVESISIKEFPGFTKITGSVLSLSGAMVFAFVKGPRINYMNLPEPFDHKMSTNPLTHGTSKESWVRGCLLMITSNTCWATWLVVQAPIIKKYPAKFRLTMLQCFFSCIQSSVWAVIKDRNISSWRLQCDLNLFSVAYCGIVVTGISYWLQLWAVESKGPLFTASFTPLILIFTAIFSALFWRERLYLGSICGGLLLVGGLYCIIWAKNKEDRKSVV